MIARRASACLHVVLLALLALVAASACRPAAAAAATGSADGFYGVNVGDLFRLPQSEWDAHLDTMAASGVQVVRLGAWWSDLEPGPPVDGVRTYAWQDVDQQVAALARHGIRWEPLLCFSATWGSQVPGDYTAAPANPADFAAFAAALTARYGPGGSFWGEHPELPALPVGAYEVWNEPNAPLYWHPAENGPEDYADLYAATRSAIHQVDGAARVLVGGLAASRSGVLPAQEWLRRMYAHRGDLRGNVDAVAFHPYARDPEGVYASLAAFRANLDEIAGPGVPIEVTEIGWTTTNVSEDRRAEYLRQLALTLPRTDCGIERMMPYAWLGPELDASDREQWFGIVNRDATPKPSATAYAGAVKQIRESTGLDTVAICGADRPSGSELSLRVEQRLRRPRLLLIARCRTGCRLRIALVTPQRGSEQALRIIRVVRRVGRRHTVSLKLARRLRRPGTRLRFTVTAIDRGGRRTTRSRTVSLRRRPAGS